MTNALSRCREKSVVMHLYGIGGIGKSSLIEHWNNSVEESIFLDCSKNVDFFDRLDSLARGAVRIGISLKRFDILWHIRQRFVIGVEPAKEKGRDWAKDVLAPIPFIGSLVTIGSALSAIGDKVSARLKGKYGALGHWLESRLGRQYMECLLEILWKEPRNAEFLYLDALLEDLNNRKTIEEPVLTLLDHFEQVDDDDLRWQYSGRRISEAELWYIFLSSLSNSVGVVGSRKSLPTWIDKELAIEKAELVELDDESCKELLKLRGISGKKLQGKVVSISGGNPFVVSSICDCQDLGEISTEGIEDLHANSLEEVRLKTWRRLFSQSKDLTNIIDRAGVLPFFDRRLMDVVAPGMKTDDWDRLVRLSFIRERGDGTWGLHKLAKELILAELGERLPGHIDEVGSLLEKASEKLSDPTLFGMALSAKALVSEKDALDKAIDVTENLIEKWRHADVLSILSSFRLDSEEGKAITLWLKARGLYGLNRFADGEHAIQEALQLFKKLAKEKSDQYSKYVALSLTDLAILLRESGRYPESEEAFQESIKLWRELGQKTSEDSRSDLANSLTHFSWLMNYMLTPENGEKSIREALQIYEDLEKVEPGRYQEKIAFGYNALGSVFSWLGSLSKQEDTLKKSLTIYKRLAEKDPDKFSNYVAAVSRNLGFAYVNLGKHLEAESAIREAVEFRKAAAKQSPETHYFRIPTELDALGSILMLDRPNEAEEAFREALQICRETMDKTPDLISMDMAEVLLDLGWLLMRTERASEAEELFKEAHQIHKQLIQDNQFPSRALLALPSLFMAILSMEKGRAKEAEEAFRKAIEIFRQASRSVRDYHSWLLVTTQVNLGNLLTRINQPANAEKMLNDAVAIARQRSEIRTESIISKASLAFALDSLSMHLRKVGRHPEAQKALSEALNLRKQLHEKVPQWFILRLAASLNNMGLLLRDVGKLDGAEDLLSQSLKHWRKRFNDVPEMTGCHVAVSLNNLGVIFSEREKKSEAKEVFHEALGILRKHVKRSPEVHQHQLVPVLNNLGILLGQMDKIPEAKKVLQEAVKIGSELTEQSPDYYLPYLRTPLSNLAFLVSQKIIKSKDLEELTNRLHDLGIITIPEYGEWIVEEQLSAEWYF